MTIESNFQRPYRFSHSRQGKDLMANTFQKEEKTMKHSLIQRMLCLALTLVMVLGMIPAGIIDFTVPVASAMTQAEKDEINA